MTPHPTPSKKGETFVIYANNQQEFDAALKTVKKAGGGTIKLGPGAYKAPNEYPDNLKLIGSDTHAPAE